MIAPQNAGLIPNVGGVMRPPGGASGGQANLADILERVLDKGIVIAGDIRVNLLDIELLTIKIRLIVASVDRAREMGIDWWEHDRSLSSGRSTPPPVSATVPAAGDAVGAGGTDQVAPAAAVITGVEVLSPRDVEVPAPREAEVIPPHAAEVVTRHD